MHKNRGFTLIEVAIVLVIIGFILSTVLGGLSAQREVIKIKEDHVLLKQVKDSLLVFVAVNGYLPCPDTDSDGLENRNANQFCVADEGDLPHLTLSGVGDKDAYGQPFFYAVNQESDTGEIIQMCRQASYFGRAGLYDPNGVPGDIEQCTISGQFYCTGDCDASDGGNCADTTTALNNECQNAVGLRQVSSPPYYRFLTPPQGIFAGFDGSLQVCSKAEDSGACSAATPDAEIAARSVAAVIVGYGENGAATRASCSNASVAERENCDGDRFYHQDNSVRDQFDDTLIWILPNEVKNSALNAGRDLMVR